MLLIAILRQLGADFGPIKFTRMSSIESPASSGAKPNETSLEAAIKGCCIPIVGEDIYKIWSRNWFEFVRILTLVIYFAIGIAYYKAKEGWSTTEATYFITASISTVGYGQLHPTDDNSRLFTIFWIFIGLILFAFSTSAYTDQYLIPLQEQITSQITYGNYSKSTKNLLFSLFLMFWSGFMGTIFYAVNEDWSSTTAFYWVFQTVCTIGYGDIYVKHDSTRAFGIFYIFMNYFLVALIIKNVRASYLEAELTQKNDDKINLLQASNSSL